MKLSDDGNGSSAPANGDHGGGLRLPRAFCPVCGSVWDDPRERCPNSANHPLPVGDKPSDE
ncbi:MAG: hypothetical protein QOD76_1329 [Solirubrobacteraceae bacterium]|jgi:hypothetical protein|nr:hypothetical protein [Solirubrobacteraceae bacterium]